MSGGSPHCVVGGKNQIVLLSQLDSTILYDESNPRSTDNVAATSQFADVAGTVEYFSRAGHFANYDEATAAPTSATSLLAMRNACKNMLYTTVNSRAYAEENLNAGMPSWMKIAIAADVGIGLALIALEAAAVKKYLARRKETA